MGAYFKSEFQSWFIFKDVLGMVSLFHYSFIKKLSLHNGHKLSNVSFSNLPKLTKLGVSISLLIYPSGLVNGNLFYGLYEIDYDGLTEEFIKWFCYYSPTLPGF